MQRAPYLIQPDGQRVTEPQRELPVARNVEVLVVGGGTAGVAAALAAARAGAKSPLIERSGYVGGTEGTAGQFGAGKKRRTASMRPLRATQRDGRKP